MNSYFRYRLRALDHAGVVCPVEILDYLERWCAKREEQEHFHTQMRVNLSAASLTLAERQAAVGALEADCAATERYAQAMKVGLLNGIAGWANWMDNPLPPSITGRLGLWTLPFAYRPLAR